MTEEKKVEVSVETDAEKKLKENIQKLKEYSEKKLTKANYESIENSYGFSYEGQPFEFRTPTIFESTRIKAIHSKITNFPGSQGTVSSGFDIYTSGDMDLMYSTKVMTHTAVLMNIPESFDINDFGEEKIYGLGELIFLSESRFFDDKKKQSTE